MLYQRQHKINDTSKTSINVTQISIADAGMYSNLVEREHIKTSHDDAWENVEDTDNQKEKGLNNKVKQKNYEWITEEKNGIRYNRLNRIRKLSAVLPPIREVVENKNDVDEVEETCWDKSYQNVCFLLISFGLFILILLALSCSLYMYKEHLEQKGNGKNYKFGEISVAEINSEKMTTSTSSTSSPPPTGPSTNSELYFPA